MLKLQNVTHYLYTIKYRMWKVPPSAPCTKVIHSLKKLYIPLLK